MVNNIKPTDVSSVAHQKIDNHASKKTVATAGADATNLSNDKKSAPQVKVTNQLSRYVDLVMAESQAPDDSARVAAMKSRIENNEYAVDHDALAKKLFSELFGG